MAFIRRARTASGATAVQVAEYVGGRKQRIIAHLGSAHTEAELGILLQQAREVLEDGPVRRPRPRPGTRTAQDGPAVQTPRPGPVRDCSLSGSTGDHRLRGPGTWSRGAKAARAPRFVKATAGAKALDEKALARARRLAGSKGYVTNVPVGLMLAGEAISSYHDLWQVEQSLRMSKTDRADRPVFHRTRDSIEAHLTIVFTALAVARQVQARTGRSIRAVARGLRPLRSATINTNGTEQTFPPRVPEPQQEILDALAR